MVGKGTPPPRRVPRNQPEYGPSRPPPSFLLAGSPRKVLPWLVLVHPDVRRQPEHPLGNDVPQDLRGSALDRVALGAQEPVAGIAAVEVGAFGAAHRPVAITQPVASEQFDFEPGDLLIELGRHQLGPRPLGAGLSGCEVLAQPFAGQPGSLPARPDPYQLILHPGSPQSSTLAPGPGPP